jgi:hypothetical protein
MGLLVFKRPVQAPAFNFDYKFTSTAAILQYACVKVGTAAGTVKPTTGASGRVVIGVAQNGATGAGLSVWVRLAGITTVKASSKAVTRGAPVRATSGAASATVGGTVKTSTTSTQNLVGLALTSRAASTAGGAITMFLSPTYNVPTAI